MYLFYTLSISKVYYYCCFVSDRASVVIVMTTHPIFIGLVYLNQPCCWLDGVVSSCFCFTYVGVSQNKSGLFLYCCLCCLISCPISCNTNLFISYFFFVFFLLVSLGWNGFQHFYWFNLHINIQLIDAANYIICSTVMHNEVLIILLLLIVAVPCCL